MTTGSLPSRPSAREAQERHAPVAKLASVGLATTLSLPGLLHQLRGHVHNIALITELLKRESATADSVASLQAATRKRCHSVREQVEAITSQLQLLEALACATDSENAHCDARAEFLEVLPALRV